MGTCGGAIDQVPGECRPAADPKTSSGTAGRLYNSSNDSNRAADDTLQYHQSARDPHRERTDLSRFRGTFHSFDPVGFAIFAILRASVTCSRCYANTLRPRSRMLLKVMKGG